MRAVRRGGEGPQGNAFSPPEPPRRTSAPRTAPGGQAAHRKRAGENTVVEKTLPSRPHQDPSRGRRRGAGLPPRLRSPERDAVFESPPSSPPPPQPAHTKPPRGAAAVALVFLLAYGVQKEMPSSKAPPPPASVGSEQPETATGMRENRQKAGTPVRPPTGGSDRETRKNEMRRQTAAAMPEEKKPADDFAPRPETSAGPAQTGLPSVPATRVSTGGGAIGTAFPGTPQAEEASGPRVLAHPESRLFRPPPYEKEVTIEVAPGDRAGLGGRLARPPLRPGGGGRPGGKGGP